MNQSMGRLPFVIGLLAALALLGASTQDGDGWPEKGEPGASTFTHRVDLDGGAVVLSLTPVVASRTGSLHRHVTLVRFQEGTRAGINGHYTANPQADADWAIGGGSGGWHVNVKLRPGLTWGQVDHADDLIFDIQLPER